MGVSVELQSGAMRPRPATGRADLMVHQWQRQMAMANGNGMHAMEMCRLAKAIAIGREDMAGRQVGEKRAEKMAGSTTAPPFNILQTPNSKPQTPTITINNNIRRRRPAALTSRLSLAAAPHPQGNGAASSTLFNLILHGHVGRGATPQHQIYFRRHHVII